MWFGSGPWKNALCTKTPEQIEHFYLLSEQSPRQDLKHEQSKSNKTFSSHKWEAGLADGSPCVSDVSEHLLNLKQYTVSAVYHPHPYNAILPLAAPSQVPRRRDLEGLQKRAIRLARDVCVWGDSQTVWNTAYMSRSWNGWVCVIYTLFNDSALLIADTVFRADLRGIWELVSVGL